MNEHVLHELQAIVGQHAIFTDLETRNYYGHDETEDYVFPPSVVLKPANTAEIAAIMKVANQHQIPVTPLGARTGLSGGALCIRQGIGLSTERLNEILHIDEQNLQITVEPAVIDRKSVV